MSDRVSTVDFHVTAACTQSCTYCWGPPRRMLALGTDEALEVIDRLAAFEVKRVVFTGGDPLLRRDIVRLICHAASRGLEVAVSTTGDHLTGDFLDATSGRVALISLPLDGSSEALNRRSKRPGHFDAVMTALDLLRAHPAVDVKVCSPGDIAEYRGHPDNCGVSRQMEPPRAQSRVLQRVSGLSALLGADPLGGLLVSDAAWAAMVRGGGPCLQRAYQLPLVRHARPVVRAYLPRRGPLRAQRVRLPLLWPFRGHRGPRHDP
ncbi:MAG: radical SAM protein [Anaerolineae bacterium]|nr:radical SAM protein [Anaerolineae bacterium]